MNAAHHKHQRIQNF